MDLRQDRRFDLEEALLDEALADGQRDLVAQPEVALHLGAAQVEVAILQAHLFVLDGVFGGRERRQARVVEDAQLGGLDLDFAGRHLGIDGVLVAQAHLAHGGDDVLRAAPASPLAWPSGVSSLSSTTWAMPLRSRTSRKIRLPWSRRRFTQPIRTTCSPALAARSSPHIWVRSSLPKKSSTSDPLFAG